VLEQCSTGELYASNSPGEAHVGACNEWSIGCRRKRAAPAVEIMVKRDCAAFTDADRAWVAAHPELSSVLGQCETGELYAGNSPDGDYVGACNEGSIGCRRRREVENEKEKDTRSGSYRADGEPGYGMPDPENDGLNPGNVV
jgi:hypothetical protein